MALTLSILCTFLLIWQVLLPLGAYYHELHARDARETYAMFKLRTVRRYYPELHKYSYEEILSEYDVNALYNNLSLK